MTTRRIFLTQAAAGLTALTSAASAATAAADASSAGAAIVPKQKLKTYRIPNTDLVVSRIACGGGIGGGFDKKPLTAEIRANAMRIVRTAYENGITLFDNADVYAFGKAEQVFGEVLKQSPGLRDRIVIQSKCGIIASSPFADPPLTDPHRFDFSFQHIVSSVEGSLRRLGTDRMDVLLLHRPDALMEPQEVAQAFDELHRSGKVRYFGVSNHTAAQIELLKKHVRQPLVVNQIQLGLMHPYPITEGLDFNRQDSRRLNQNYTGAAGTLDYCRLHEIQIQAYSPIRGLNKSSSDASPAVKQTMQLLTEIGQRNGASPYAVALAWLLRHPAGIVPITGAQKTEHIVDNCLADRISLSREEWYALLLAATGRAPLSML